MKGSPSVGLSASSINPTCDPFGLSGSSVRPASSMAPEKRTPAGECSFVLGLRPAVREGRSKPPSAADSKSWSALEAPGEPGAGRGMVAPEKMMSAVEEAMGLAGGGWLGAVGWGQRLDWAV
jgi:hypothetical protein